MQPELGISAWLTKGGLREWKRQSFGQLGEVQHLRGRSTRGRENNEFKPCNVREDGVLLSCAVGQKKRFVPYSAE
jgi:hypothetical protein